MRSQSDLSADQKKRHITLDEIEIPEKEKKLEETQHRGWNYTGIAGGALGLLLINARRSANKKSEIDPMRSKEFIKDMLIEMDDVIEEACETAKISKKQMGI